MYRRISILWLILMVGPLLSGAGLAVEDLAGAEVLVLTIDGPLTPAMLTYLERGVAWAEAERPEILILQLDTPGGSTDIMDKMVECIRASRTPVVVFVAPRGAMAGSAGTVIALAGHAVAMAPETVIGAASPVGGQGEDLDSTMDAKVKEILKAKVRNLAARRGPAAIALAEAAIESAKAATAAEAHQAGLVDFLADDLADLLRQLDGFEVEVGGERRPLSTLGLTRRDFQMSPIETLLDLLTNPNIVFLLLAVGVQAILIELYTPGGWVAGFIGVVCLALAFYGMGVLPVNWFGIIFIIAAVVLFFMEINTPTHGALAAAGAGSLIVGALVLFNSPGVPRYFHVNMWMVGGVAAALLASFMALMALGLRAMRLPLASGVESLVGKEGEARSPESVLLGGEMWTAEPMDGVLKAGDRVIVTAVRGLKLLVRKKP